MILCVQGKGIKMLSDKTKKKILQLISKDYLFSYDQVRNAYENMGNLFDIVMYCMDLSLVSGKSLEKIVEMTKKNLTKQDK